MNGLSVNIQIVYQSFFLLPGSWIFFYPNFFLCALSCFAPIFFNPFYQYSIFHTIFPFNPFLF